MPAFLLTKNFWIAVVIAALIGGVVLKIKLLNGKIEDLQEQVKVEQDRNHALQGNNNVLKQNLEMCLDVNDQNATILKELKVDQDNAARTLRRLNTDLSSSKITLDEARRKINDTQLPSVPVPKTIVDTIIVIQDERTKQAAINKQLEAELK